MTWSEAFDAYLKRRKIAGSTAAIALGKSASVVHYWRRGSVPHDEQILKHVEEWTGGKVKASLAKKRAA